MKILFLFCVVFGQRLVREAHLRRFASLCAAPCMHIHVRASKARKSSTSGTSAPRHCPFIPKFPALTGNFGIVAEFTIGLRFANGFGARCSQPSNGASTYKSRIGHIMEDRGLRFEMKHNVQLSQGLLCGRLATADGCAFPIVSTNYGSI